MMRRSFAVLSLGFAALSVAAGIMLAPSQTEAAGPTFVIPANDGYGIAECVESASPCGKVVADAWCEAQGFRRSASVGPVDVETTGSIDSRRGRISVTCAP